MSADVLTIVVPGKPISGNHAKIPTGNGRQVRSEESRTYDRRIAEIAKAAATLMGWEMPDYVRVDIVAANCRADRDNIEKEVLDPLQGIAFAYDSRILDGRTKRVKDHDGPRVIVQVSAVNGRNYGFDAPRKPSDEKPKPLESASSAEAKRRTAARPRMLAQLRSGDSLTDAEADVLLREKGLR